MYPQDRVMAESTGGATVTQEEFRQRLLAILIKTEEQLSALRNATDSHPEIDNRALWSVLTSVEGKLIKGIEICLLNAKVLEDEVQP